MLLTLTTTHSPATDLGFLLHKHPQRFQSFSTSFGQTHVFFPVATDAGCSACLLLDVDPIKMAKGKRRRSDTVLSQYVNDRPWVASSFISTAIAQAWGSALNGRCKERPELARAALPFSVELPALAVHGGQAWLQELFLPLGYAVEAESLPLDPRFPQWGDSHYYRVRLEHRLPLAELLSHLYVLIPVFDNYKHYFVGADEMEKLLRRGESWLASHPQREAIAQRYLRRQSSLVREALARLAETDVEVLEEADEREPDLERPLSLHQQRLAAVAEALESCGAAKIIDLGCGEGKLLRQLIRSARFRKLDKLIGVDVSVRALEHASRRLRLERMRDADRQRVELLQGSLMYRDERFAGFDAAALVEVIEHLPPSRLAAMEEVVFRHARPTTVIVTTPNAEYNVMWETLAQGQFRHGDHRFEWSRDEFRQWAEGIAQRFGYAVELRGIGDEAEELGPPTQMAVFQRDPNASAEEASSE